jgi:glycosyltransferase involved in cell wall biosynthesis
MRVALVSPSMGFGGAERMVAMLAGGLAERGHEVVLLAPPGELDADLAGVSHERVRLDDHGRGILGAASTGRQLARALRRARPDVVHAQNVKASAIARVAVAAADGRVPLLSTFHGVTPGEYRRAALLLRGAQTVVCVSQDLREGIVRAGLPAARVKVIANAVPLAGPLDEPRREALDAELGLGQAPVISIVGRLVPQKAHGRFLRAARVILDSFPDARLLIVGDGPLRRSIEHDVSSAGLANSVRLTGARSDAREIAARSDVIVFSSDWEGLSIAALEALAAATPIVATDVHGMRELLRARSADTRATGAAGPQPAGAVVALDDGTALGERVVALLHDPAELSRMGAAGRALIGRSYSPAEMVDAYLAAYADLAPRS